LQKYHRLFLPEAMDLLCNKALVKCNIDKLFKNCANTLINTHQNYEQEIQYFNEFNNKMTYQRPNISICVNYLMVRLTQEPNWLELAFCCLLKI
jgi:hypothetical protein